MEVKMKAWFRSIAALAVVFALALIFSGQVMLASEKLVYIPKTTHHPVALLTEPKTVNPTILPNQYFPDSFVFIPTIGDHSGFSFAGPETVSAEKRSTRLVVDGSYYIPNIQGP